MDGRCICKEMSQPILLSGNSDGDILGRIDS